MNTKEICDAEKKKLAVFGNSSVLAGLKRGTVTSVAFAKNCDKNITDKIKSLAAVLGVKTEVLDEASEELGVLCKKTFSVSVVGLTKKSD